MCKRARHGVVSKMIFRNSHCKGFDFIVLGNANGNHHDLSARLEDHLIRGRVSHMFSVILLGSSTSSTDTTPVAAFDGPKSEHKL